MHTYIPTCIRTYPHAFIQTHMHTYMIQTHMHTSMHTYIPTCMPTRIYTYPRTYMQISSCKTLIRSISSVKFHLIKPHIFKTPIVSFLQGSCLIQKKLVTWYHAPVVVHTKCHFLQSSLPTKPHDIDSA